MEGLEVNSRFWQNKRVFVTGHTGFKGSWLCSWLARLGATVTGYALAPPSNPNLFAAASLSEVLTSIEGDVRDAAFVREQITAFQPEIVFHLAAQSLVIASYESPLETFETNIIGTANVLEALRTCPSARAAVIVTSDKCYDLTTPDVRHREDDPLGGHDPYSASKAGAELVTAAFRTSFFSGRSKSQREVAIATARAGNVMGGGDWSKHRLIPDAVRAFTQHSALLLRNPSAVRPWQHVLDPLRGYLILAQQLFTGSTRFARAWNFGPPQSHEITVESVVREFAQAWGSDARFEIDNHAHFPEAAVLRLNSELAQRELGWQTQIPLSQAIRTTARWYRSYQDGDRASDLVDADISDMEALALH